MALAVDFRPCCSAPPSRPEPALGIGNPSARSLLSRFLFDLFANAQFKKLLLDRACIELSSQTKATANRHAANWNCVRLDWNYSFLISLCYFFQEKEIATRLKTHEN
jgi:hypothetical protein